MTKGMILIFPLSTSHIYVAKSRYHLHNYGVYISQHIRYARVCSVYDRFLSRGRQLTNKLMLQGFLQPRLSQPLASSMAVTMISFIITNFH
jgi:hypothetical protein